MLLNTSQSRFTRTRTQTTFIINYSKPSTFDWNLIYKWWDKSITLHSLDADSPIFSRNAQRDESKNLVNAKYLINSEHGFHSASAQWSAFIQWMIRFHTGNLFTCKFRIQKCACIRFGKILIINFCIEWNSVWLKCRKWTGFSAVPAVNARNGILLWYAFDVVQTACDYISFRWMHLCGHRQWTAALYD